MKLHYVTLLNVVLRTGTLGTRFALVFVLAKYLDAAALGYYGMFTAAIGYALLCVGLDMYVFTTREMVGTDPARRGSLLKNQAAIVGILYVVLIPIATLILPAAGLPTFLVRWFVPILILEHLNQEIYRLLVVLSRQLSASILLFIRQGSWAIAAAAMMAFNDASRNLGFVMSLWVIAGASAAAAGIWQLHRLRLGGWRERVDWLWIRRGLRVSGAFLIATLSVRAVQTVDRYWLQDIANIEVVGAYVLFFGVVSALSVFLDAAVFSFRYPELMALAKQGEHGRMRANVWRTAVQTTAISIAFAVVSILLIPYLLGWIGKAVYRAEIDIYYWVLAASIAYSLSLIPHYALYAVGRDRAIVTSHIAALLVFVVATWCLQTLVGYFAVPVGVLIAMTMVLIWKTIVYLHVFYSRAAHDAPPDFKNGLSQ